MRQKNEKIPSSPPMEIPIMHHTDYLPDHWDHFRMGRHAAGKKDHRSDYESGKGPGEADHLDPEVDL